MGRVAQPAGQHNKEEGGGAWKKYGRHGTDKKEATAISARGFEVEDKGRAQLEEEGGKRRGNTTPFSPPRDSCLKTV